MRITKSSFLGQVSEGDCARQANFLVSGGGVGGGADPPQSAHAQH